MWCRWMNQGRDRDKDAWQALGEGRSLEGECLSAGSSRISGSVKFPAGHHASQAELSLRVRRSAHCLSPGGAASLAGLSNAVVAVSCVSNRVLVAPSP